MFCVATYLYGKLWAYSTVFGNAFSAYAMIFGTSPYLNYVVYLLVFAFLVVPTSLFEFHEQVRMHRHIFYILYILTYLITAILIYICFPPIKLVSSDHCASISYCAPFDCGLP